MNLSIKVKINTIIITTISCSLIVAGFVEVWTETTQREEEQKIKTKHTAQRLSYVLSLPIKNYDISIGNKMIEAEMTAKDIVCIVALENATGSILLGRAKTPEGKLIPCSDFSFIKGKLLKDTSEEIKDDEISMGEVTVFTTDKFIIEKQKRHIKFLIVKFIFIIFVTTIISSLAVIKFVTSPIKSMIILFSRIANGEMNATIPLNQNDELGELAHSFKIMKDSISDKMSTIEVQKQNLKTQFGEKVEAQQQAESIKYYLNNVIDSMPSAIIGVDDDLNILQWNLAAMVMFVEDAASLIGTNIKDHDLGLNETIFKHITDSISENMIHEIKKQKLKINNEIGTFDIQVYPLVDTNNKGAVIRIENVTEQERITGMLVQHEKMLSLGSLAAGMAHEINNPLGGIMQGIQNTLRRMSPDMQANINEAEKLDLDLKSLDIYLENRKIKKFLAGCMESCNKAAKIVKNMLSFSRNPNASMISTDAKELLESTILLGYSDYDIKKKYDFKYIEMERDYDNCLPHILCQPTELEQVLLNLMKNSVYAMESIKDENYAPKFTLKLKAEPEYVRIEIGDNGPGIPADIKSRIFEPFFTTKPIGIGTGLGLSVSYSIITANHNGTMEVVSEEGKGSNFIIRIPIYRSKDDK